LKKDNLWGIFKSKKQIFLIGITIVLGTFLVVVIFSSVITKSAVTRLSKECEKIEDPVGVSLYYQEIGKKYSYLSMCNKIENEIGKESCYLGVAKAKQDLSICEKIKEQSFQDGCYYEVAVVKKGSSICEKIKKI